MFYFQFVFTCVCVGVFVLFACFFRRVYEFEFVQLLRGVSCTKGMKENHDTYTCLTSLARRRCRAFHSFSLLCVHSCFLPELCIFIELASINALSLLLHLLASSPLALACRTRPHTHTPNWPSPLFTHSFLFFSFKAPDSFSLFFFRDGIGCPNLGCLFNTTLRFLYTS